MNRRLATRGGILLPGLLALVLQTGCGGDAEISIVKPDNSPDVAGVVYLPSGVTAGAGGLLSRFAALIVARAEALIGVAPAADAPVDVTRLTQEDILSGAQIGTTQVGSTTTGSDGRYQVSLGNDIIDDCGGGRILVSTTAGGALTRAFAYSDQEDITVNAASEAVVKTIFAAVRDQGADLCTPTNDQLRDLVVTADNATADVTGATVAQINANALVAVLEDPDYVALLGQSFDLTSTPTRTRTRTSTPTGTNTPTTGTGTPTNTPAATATNTAAPTTTNTPVATNTGEPTSTNTPVATNTGEPTSTNTPVATNTGEPTSTNTPVATNTGEPTSTNTPVTTATDTPPFDTPTSTPVDTATNTPVPTATTGNVPNVAIGSTSGEAGALVTVPFTLTKNGPSINVIAPLNFTFDDTRLTIGSCTSAVTGKNPTVNVNGNAVGVSISGTEEAFPDGVFLNCTFTIKAAATGVAPVNFVSAGMSDLEFNDYSATGSSGQVTIGGAGPTNTPTEAVATATAVPPTSTATVAVPTNTSVPATDTPTVAVPTNTSVPSTSTPTTAVNTPTPTTGGGSVPNVAIGSTSGAAGALVTVPFSLTKNGPSINVIAPLNFTFDDTRLTVGTCTSTVTGKNPTVNVNGNAVGVSISGTEEAFPDGVFLNCTFTIKAAATGVAPVNFVSAGMSDLEFNDYSATGSSGQVTIGGGEQPTSTPTAAAPTATSAPATSTATIAVPTNTSVPSTSTPTIAVPTNTSVPSTSTPTVPAAATSTPTVAASGPVVNIGSTSGAAGALVTVPFSLTKNGPTINVIAPLSFTFDDTRLTVGSCTSTVTGKNPTVNVNGNAVGVSISGTEEAFPDGVFLNCTFTIKAAATGSAAVTFVSAGMSDVEFNDFTATGTSGSVTIN